MAADFKSKKAIILDWKIFFFRENFDKAISKCFERPIMWITTAYDVVKRSIPPIKSVRIIKKILNNVEKFDVKLLFSLTFLYRQK